MVRSLGSFVAIQKGCLHGRPNNGLGEAMSEQAQPRRIAAEQAWQTGTRLAYQRSGEFRGAGIAGLSNR